QQQPRMADRGALHHGRGHRRRPARRGSRPDRPAVAAAGAAKNRDRAHVDQPHGRGALYHQLLDAPQFAGQGRHRGVVVGHRDRPARHFRLARREAGLRLRGRGRGRARLLDAQMMRGMGLPLRALLGVVAAACAACATHTIAPAAAPSRASFDRALIAKGAQLSAIGNCQVCHTAERGRSFAGGRALETPFGTMYATNITPDADTGIGRWSEEAFRRALREGVDREGRHLYPVFPYEYYTRLADEDIRALYAFVMTREPIRAPNRPHELRPPFNVRALL